MLSAKWETVNSGHYHFLITIIMGNFVLRSNFESLLDMFYNFVFILISPICQLESILILPQS